jgi:hypothetical protein
MFWFDHDLSLEENIHLILGKSEFQAHPLYKSFENLNIRYETRSLQHLIANFLKMKNYKYPDKIHVCLAHYVPFRARQKIRVEGFPIQTNSAKFPQF